MTIAGPSSPPVQSPDRAHWLPNAQTAVRRFTLDGDAALETHLAKTCARVLSGIRGLIPEHKLQAVWLGGGYGRGEGGVLREAGGDRPYNDLEFYVAIQGSRHLSEFRFQHRLEVLGEILTHLADVEVEFKITSLEEMARRPISMFSYDLMCGHRTLWLRDPAGLVAECRHHGSAESIPAAEATRLLMNRCSGLLLAHAELGREHLTPTAADFVRRNIAKVQLACGDAILTAHGRYRWSCVERHRRLVQLSSSEPSPWLDSVLKHHAAGVEFKLHPTIGALSREALIFLRLEVTELARQTWLTLEARRLRRAFPSARSYAQDPGNKCPGSSRILNPILNFRANGFRWRSRPSPWRHPRERIFRALAMLLWEPAHSREPDLRAQLDRELNTHDDTPAARIAAYQALWRLVR